MEEASRAALDADERPYLPTPDETVFRMRQRMHEGAHWFVALLEAVADWRLPEETYGGRRFRYLVGGEAFDWVLLAERLLGDVRDVVPQREAEALLWEGRWPIDLTNDEFTVALGPAKHSAHLNYLYGVLVEEALQLHVEEEMHKESRARAWGYDPRDDEGMYRRVYGRPLNELRSLYYEETGQTLGQQVDYADWKAFTYWCFKLRLKRQDKARVASDTRKGLAQLTRMELAVAERRRGAELDEGEFQRRYMVEA